MNAVGCQAISERKRQVYAVWARRRAIVCALPMECEAAMNSRTAGSPDLPKMSIALCPDLWYTI